MKILYIIMLIAAAVFYPLFKDDLSFILLITLLVIPVVLGAMLIITAKKLKIRAGETGFRAVRGEALNFEIEIKNPVPLPVSGCRINVRYRMAGDRNWGKYSVSLPLKAASTEKITVSLKAAHCGVLEFRAEKAVISDLIGLFSIKKKTGISGKAVIFPKELPCFPAWEEVPAQKDDSGLINAGRGSDPAEIVDLREYTEGDRLNRIHWKLSSRSSSFIVKELADDYSGRIVLVPDTDACRDSSERDDVMDVFFSLGRFAVKRSAECALLTADDGFRADIISDEESLDTMTAELSGSFDSAKRDISMTAAFSEECSAFAGDRFAHLVIITPRESHAILSEIEQSCCAEKITVLCTGRKGAVEEVRSSDVIVYFIKNKGGLELPEHFVL